LRDEKADSKSRKLELEDPGKILIELVRSKGPVSKADLQEIMVPKHLSRSAYYRRVEKFERIGVIKEIRGHLVSFDYVELEDEIAATIRNMRRQNVKEPSIESVALEVGKPPEDLGFRTAFYRVARKLRWGKIENMEELVHSAEYRRRMKELAEYRRNPMKRVVEEIKWAWIQEDAAKKR